MSQAFLVSWNLQYQCMQHIKQGKLPEVFGDPLHAIFTLIIWVRLMEYIPIIAISWGTWSKMKHHSCLFFPFFPEFPYVFNISEPMIWVFLWVFWSRKMKATRCPTMLASSSPLKSSARLLGPSGWRRKPWGYQHDIAVSQHNFPTSYYMIHTRHKYPISSHIQFYWIFTITLPTSRYVAPWSPGGLVVEVHGLTAAAGTGHGHGLRSLGEGTREVTGTPGTTAVWRFGTAWESHGKIIERKIWGDY